MNGIILTRKQLRRHQPGREPIAGDRELMPCEPKAHLPQINILKEFRLQSILGKL